MKILIIGGGGREHALAWKFAQSPRVRKVYVAPGNGGTVQETKTENVSISAEDIPQLKDFAQKNDIDLTIVGPEAPLVSGIVDEFRDDNLPIFGPTKGAAQLEGSKSFTKDFLNSNNIPTASYGSFTDPDKAIAYIKRNGAPIVVKADGLAAGKGVIIARSENQAISAVKDMLSGNAFGNAGHRVVIEEYLTGEEASFICMVDGEHILPMATSQDHKKRDDGDQGPNTGGMGAYSPAPIVTPELHEHIMTQIINPTVQGMKSKGYPYTGFLYAGLMITSGSIPKVLEFNCRFGDPETQPIVMRLNSDLTDLCLAALAGRLDTVHADWDPRTALGIVMAASGYPDHYRKGDIIEGIPEAESETTKIFQAGTFIRDGQILNNGGRVLCVTSLGTSMATAQKNAYEGVRKINWPSAYYRKDIGYRALS